MNEHAKGSVRRLGLLTGGRRRAVVAAASAGAAFLVGGSLAASGAFAASARSAGPPSCALVPSSMVSAVLGLPVGQVRVSSPLRGQIRCLYPEGSNQAAVQIVFTAGSRVAFAQKEKAYRNGGALAFTGIGDGAFTPSISTSAGSTSDLYAHQHSTELDIAAIAPISRLESLARKVVPHL